MIIIKNASDFRVLINIGQISYIEEKTGMLLIFLEGGAVVPTSETWEEVIMKIKSIGGSQ